MLSIHELVQRNYVKMYIDMYAIPEHLAIK